MYDTNITLRKIERTAGANTDEYGNLLPPTTTDVNRYAEVKSVTQKEFYEAAAKGFKAEIKAVLPAKEEYSNEEQVIINGVVYDVIRTYEAGGSTIEIICGKGL